MKKAFKQNLIESIETQLHKARIAQETIERTNQYFIDLFTGYKSHLEEKKNEIPFSNKLELLKRVFNAYPPTTCS